MKKNSASMTVTLMLIGSVLVGCVPNKIARQIYQDGEARTSTGEIPDDRYCIIESDCVFTQYDYSCCPIQCNGVVVNKNELENRERWILKNCPEYNEIDCPVAICEFRPENRYATCENNKCVEKVELFCDIICDSTQEKRIYWDPNKECHCE